MRVFLLDKERGCMRDTEREKQLKEDIQLLEQDASRISACIPRIPSYIIESEYHYFLDALAEFKMKENALLREEAESLDQYFMLFAAIDARIKNLQEKIADLKPLLRIDTSVRERGGENSSERCIP